MYTDQWDEHPFRDSYVTFEEYPYCPGNEDGSFPTLSANDIICN